MLNLEMEAKNDYTSLTNVLFLTPLKFKQKN